MTSDIDAALIRARNALQRGVSGMTHRLDDCTRVARLAVLAGVRSDGLDGFLADRQQADGGWIDVEETAWCAAALPPESDVAQAAMAWLAESRLEEGGWGRSRRDVRRVLTTGLVLRLHPGIGLDSDWNGLEQSWAKDLNSDLALTYKGAAYLMCQASSCHRNSDLERDTVAFITRNLNDDGGLGPWKAHPVGSDPWTTGICLVALSSADSDPAVLEGCSKWLCDHQLESGHWPYHFIDEGSVYAYWGLSEVGKARGQS